MAIGYSQIYNNVSQLKTFDDLVRFVSAFTSDVAQKINAVIAVKEVYGAIGSTGAIGFTGSGNFGASLVTTGSYYIAFREAYSTPPVVTVTPLIGYLFYLSGVTATGFTVNFNNTTSTPNNTDFHFHAKGAR